jgi:hypothetical protein
MAKNDRTMNRSDASGGSSGHVRSGRSKLQSLTPSQPGGTRIQLPPGGADLEELRSVTREWLVPRLVEKFLQVHGVELKHSHLRANRLQPLPSGQSAGAIENDIRSQAKKKTKYRALM